MISTEGKSLEEMLKSVEEAWPEIQKKLSKKSKQKKKGQI